MACCTTISPVSSPKKRGASSMFELPRSAKRRRGTMLTTLNQVNGAGSAATAAAVNNDYPAFTTSAASIFNSYNSAAAVSKATPSCFDLNMPLDMAAGLSSRYNHEDLDSSSSSSSSSDTDDIMHRIKKEAKRLLKRKQEQQIKQQQEQLVKSSKLDANNNTQSTCKAASSSTASNKLDNTSSPSIASSNLSSFLSNVKRKEVPLFTMSQVNAICEKMVKEREAIIREQYDKILTQKLSEQYDAFVKFTHEQIQRRFEHSQCSYVS